MNFLIIGILFIVAIAAIIGAVLFLRGDDRTATPAANPPTLPALSNPAYTPGDDRRSATNRMTTSTGQVAPLPRRNPIPSRVEERHPTELNALLHELFTELRRVQRQIAEIEQRSHQLNEIALRIEQAQNERMHIEEETGPSTSFPTEQ